MLTTLVLFALYAMAALGVLALGRTLGWWPFYSPTKLPGYSFNHPNTSEYRTLEIRKIGASSSEREKIQARLEEIDAMDVDAAEPYGWAVLWPVAIVAITFHRVKEVADRTRIAKTRLRSELEKELAEARQQVEDLLHGKAP